VQESASVFRKFIGQSGIYTVGGIIGRMSAFITLPILTRAFSRDQYGLLSIVSLTVFLLGAVAKLGMQHSAVRFYDEFRLKRRNGGLGAFYSTLFWGSLAVAIVVAAVFAGAARFVPFIFNEKVPYSLFLIIGGLAIAEAMRARTNNFFRIEQKAHLFMFLTIVDYYGKMIVGLLFLFFIAKSIQSFLFGTLIFSLFVIPVFAVGSLGRESLRPSHFSLSFLKENAVYGYPLVGFELSSILIKLSDRYLVQIFLGAAALGLYSVGGNLAMSVSEGLFTPIWLAVSPMFMRIWSEHGDDKTQEFLSNVIKILALVSLPMVFGLAAVSRDVVVVLASAKYAEAASSIPYLMAGAVLWGFCPILGAGLHIHKKTKQLNNLTLIGAVFNVCINLVVIPRWGILGAAVTTLITYILVVLLIVRVSFRYLRLRIDAVAMAHFVFASLCMYVLLIAAPLNVSLLNLVLKITGGAVIYCAVLLIINQEMRKYGAKTLHMIKAVKPPYLA